MSKNAWGLVSSSLAMSIVDSVVFFKGVGEGAGSGAVGDNDVVDVGLEVDEGFGVYVDGFLVDRD